MNDNDTENTTTGVAGKLTTLLTGWGVPGALARILVAMLLGALGAICAMTETSCTVAAYHDADGSSAYALDLDPLALRELLGSTPSTNNN